MSLLLPPPLFTLLLKEQHSSAVVMKHKLKWTMNAPPRPDVRDSCRENSATKGSKYDKRHKNRGMLTNTRAKSECKLDLCNRKIQIVTRQEIIKKIKPQFILRHNNTGSKFVQQKGINMIKQGWQKTEECQAANTNSK